MTIDTSKWSPTYIGGAAAAIGMAILGAPVAYPALGTLPHWLVVTAIVMTAAGTALAHFGSADAKDVPPTLPPQPPIQSASEPVKQTAVIGE